MSFWENSTTFFKHLIHFLIIIYRVLKPDILELLWCISSTDLPLKQPLSKIYYKQAVQFELCWFMSLHNQITYELHYHRLFKAIHFQTWATAYTHSAFLCAPFLLPHMPIYSLKNERYSWNLKESYVLITRLPWASTEVF